MDSSRSFTTWLIKAGIAIAVLAVFIVVTVGIASRASAGRSGNQNGIRTAFLGGNVELHVTPPFIVTTVWSGPTFNFDGSPITVYPGQKIAEGVLRIENRSPFDYGAYVRAEPQEVLGGTYPYLEVKVWIGETLFYSPKDIPAGTTVEMRVEIFIPYGAPISSFQGLDVIVDAGPPPTETIAECPADGCG